METECPLALILLACLVMSNKEVSKWFLIVACVYAFFKLWYVTVPLLLLVGSIWGICWLFSSGRAKGTVVLGGLILGVAGAIKLFPWFFEKVVGVICVAFWAYVACWVLWNAVSPLKRLKHKTGEV